MREQIDLLVKIQEKDQTLDELNRRIGEGPQRIKDGEQEVRALEQDLEADRRQIQENLKLQRQYEAEVEDGVERIKKRRARLLTIKNNKEYQAVLKEIEETEKANAEKDDKILGCMEEMETLRERVQAKEQYLAAMLDRFEKEKKDTEAEIGRAKEQVFEEQNQRESMVKILDPTIFAKYEQLKASCGNLAVAIVEHATCSGCHMSIPPQMYNELQRRDSLKFCPNCERIIYWKKSR